MEIYCPKLRAVNEEYTLALQKQDMKVFIEVMGIKAGPEIV